jgi:hypothetical protein
MIFENFILSGSFLDLDSDGSVDPDPGRQKWPTKKVKKFHHRIPDPQAPDPESATKSCIFNPKKLLLNSRIYDPECFPWIRIFFIPEPRKIALDAGSLIRTTGGKKGRLGASTMRQP